jgi:uncharacterized repeat protein (TIGR03806 family)
MMKKKNFTQATLIFLVAALFVGLYSCTSDQSDEFEDYDIDTDGDGIFDSQEVLDGTDKNNPCDPGHDLSYSAYDPLNLLWQSGDCDGDGVNNADELSLDNNPYGDPVERDLAVPEYLPNLSQLKLFKGNLADFQFNDNVYEYSMITPLFTDYAHKLRVVAIPDGEQLTYKGEGLLEFPDNSIMAKTFYYLNDERDPSLGKKIIETRVLIKKEGEWLVRNYFWNEDQTDAVLDDDLHALPVNWIDGAGIAKSVDYVVPPNNMCIQCHNKDGVIKPIGPKARVMNFEHKGQNVLQYFKDNNLLANAPDISEIPTIPDWSDENLPLEDRARAYLDVNCAHCHQTGGSYNSTFGDNFQFTYETPFEDSNIFQFRTQIKDRMNTQIPGYFMPLIGVNIKHDEGLDLMNAYIDSLEP